MGLSSLSYKFPFSEDFKGTWGSNFRCSMCHGVRCGVGGLIDWMDGLDGWVVAWIGLFGLG